MNTVTVIRNEEQYQAAMTRIDELIRANALDGQPGDLPFEELELLSVLVWAYEQEHEKPEPPDPVEAIKFAMERRGMKPKDLVPYFGTIGQVSDVLNRRRGLSLRMIRNLHEGLGISLEALVKKAPVKRQPKAPVVRSRHTEQAPGNASHSSRS